MAGPQQHWILLLCYLRGAIVWRRLSSEKAGKDWLSLPTFGKQLAFAWETLKDSATLFLHGNKTSHLGRVLFQTTFLLGVCSSVLTSEFIQE